MKPFPFDVVAFDLDGTLLHTAQTLATRSAEVHVLSSAEMMQGERSEHPAAVHE